MYPMHALPEESTVTLNSTVNVALRPAKVSRQLSGVFQVERSREGLRMGRCYVTLVVGSWHAPVKIIGTPK